MAEELFRLDVCIFFVRVEMIVQSYSHVVYTKLVDVSGAIMVELSGVMMCEVWLPVSGGVAAEQISRSKRFLSLRRNQYNSNLIQIRYLTAKRS